MQHSNDGSASSKIIASDAEEDIAEYRHEVWRLANWQDRPRRATCRSITQRIATKNGENTAKLAAWKEQVQTIEEGLGQDFDAILTAEQQDPGGRRSLRRTRPWRTRISTNWTSSTWSRRWSRSASESCLIFGFFTRLAAIVGGFIPVRRDCLAAVLDLGHRTNDQSMRRTGSDACLGGNGCGPLGGDGWLPGGPFRTATVRDCRRGLNL